MKLLSLLSLVLLLGCASPRGIPPTHGSLNLDQVDSHLWRAGSVSYQGLAYVKSQGVTTVIDFSANAAWTGERQACQELGLAYYAFPLSGVFPPTNADVDHALALIEASPGAALVRCVHGCERTGVVVASYRISKGWSSKDALKEAKRYGLSPWAPGFSQFIKQRVKD